MKNSSEEGGGIAGRRIGPFRLLERIGTGGMGEVFLAEGGQVGPRRVALKVMRAEKVDRRLAARFELEQQALARMDHPNIARIFESGVTDEGQPWFAMEHVPGLPLTDYCDEHRLPLEQRLRLFQQVCDGVHHAHGRGILHRDLKPSNILVREVDDKPIAKIIDFGLARPVDPMDLRATLHEELARIIGTIAYMSPEQAGLTPEDVDTRADVYSLGVVLYELLVGALPFAPEDLARIGPLQLPNYLREHEPTPPSTRLSDHGDGIAAVAERRGLDPRRLRTLLGGELEWVTMKALERDRHRRYDSARDFGRDIERFLAQRPVEAGPPGMLYRLRKWSQRHAAGVAVGGVLLGAGLVTGTATWLMAERAAAAENERRIEERAFVVQELLRRADEDLWPIEPTLPERCRDWLPRAEVELAGQPEIVAFAAALAQQVADLGDAAPDDLTKRRERVQATVDRLETLKRVKEKVHRRIERAETMVARSLDAHAAAWDAAIDAIAQSPLYGGFAMPRVPGLVPLGANPQGCHEFLLLESDLDGVLPVRRADGGFDIHRGDGLVMVLVPGGEVVTGASTVPGAVHFDPDAMAWEAEFRSTIAPFLIARCEMTQDQWARMMCEGDADAATLDWQNPSNIPTGKLQAVAFGPGMPNDIVPSLDHTTWLHPVQQLDWKRAMLRLQRYGLTLPTCVQWERAARGGADSPLGVADASELPKFANLYWVDKDASGRRFDPQDGFVWTAPVGALHPNGYGLCDVLGNVAELCGDIPGLLVDDVAFAPGSFESPRKHYRSVHRGGSFHSAVGDLRIAAIQQVPIVNIEPDFGIRPVLQLPSR